MNESPKKLVNGVFSSREVPRAPFIPLISNFAAKLMHLTWQDLTSDPELLSKTFRDVQKLFGYDAIVLPYDQFLEAEALGCEILWENGKPQIDQHIPETLEITELDIANLEFRGRLPVILEATQRLKQTVTNDVPLIGVITGPVTLAANLAGSRFLSEYITRTDWALKTLDICTKVNLGLIRSYCEKNLVDAVLIRDELLAAVASNNLDGLKVFYKTIANVCSYYNKKTILAAGEIDCAILDCILKFDLDGSITSSSDYCNVNTDNKRKFFGVSLSNAIITATEQEMMSHINAFLAQSVLKKYFLTTQGELPEETPVENLHALVKTLKN